jgi:EmrB/QacA subfamily drug resistance transporter
VGGRAAATGVLLAACVSTLIVNANTSAVTILLPAIGEDVGSPVSTLQWAVTGYSLVGAACIVTSGALGDVFGRRKVFLGGLVLFIASCILIALAQSGVAVILGRAVQGAAGSTLLASGLSLLTIATDGPDRLRAVSYWGSASAIGAAAGPLVGGLLVDSLGWQALFWIDAAIAAVLVPLTLKTVAESSDPARSRSIDWMGTVLVALVLAPLILGVSEGADWGWTSAATLATFAVSAVSLVLFVVVEKRVPAPLVDLALLRNRMLIGATLGILIGAATINGLMFVISLFFQDPSTLGMSPLEAGLATLPATVGMVALTPAVPKLAEKYGTRSVIGVGFIVMTAGFVLLWPTQSSWGYGRFVLPLVLVAVGMCLSNNPCSSVATSSVGAAQVGAASGISNMARYVGAAVMTAIVAAFYSVVSTDEAAGGEAAGDALAAGFRAASVALTIVSALGIVLVYLVGRHRPPPPTTGVDVAIAAAAPAHTIPHPARV